MEEKKEKTIYKNQSIIIWIVVVLLSIAIGRNVFPLVNSSFKSNGFIFSLLFLILGYILSTIIYEVGKIIFGLIAGYRLVRTNILGFTWTKNNKFSFTKFVRYGGETIMAPRKDNASIVLYSLGGTIFSILVNVISLVLLTIFTKNTNKEYLLFIQYVFSTLTLIVLIFNIAPFLEDEIYDGFILRIRFSKKDSIKKYHELLLQQEALLTNKGNLSLIEDFDYTNPLLNSAYIINCYYYIDHNDFEKAKKIANEGIKNGNYLSDYEKAKLYNIKFYFDFMDNKEEKIGEEFYKLDRGLRKQIINPHNYESLKVALLIASLIDSSYDLYDYLYLQIEKDKKKYPFKSRLEVEENLLNKSLNLIEQKKVEWFKKEND